MLTAAFRLRPVCAARRSTYAAARQHRRTPRATPPQQKNHAGAKGWQANVPAKLHLPFRPDLRKYTTDPTARPFDPNFTVHVLCDNIATARSAAIMERLWCQRKNALYPTGYVAITGNPYASGRLHNLRKHGRYSCPRGLPPAAAAPAA